MTGQLGPSPAALTHQLEVPPGSCVTIDPRLGSVNPRTLMPFALPFPFGNLQGSQEQKLTLTEHFLYVGLWIPVWIVTAAAPSSHSFQPGERMEETGRCFCLVLLGHLLWAPGHPAAREPRDLGKATRRFSRPQTWLRSQPTASISC